MELMFSVDEAAAYVAAIFSRQDLLARVKAGELKLYSIGEMSHFRVIDFLKFMMTELLPIWTHMDSPGKAAFISTLTPALKMMGQEKLLDDFLASVNQQNRKDSTN